MLHYTQGVTHSHSVNSDFYWYQIADTINIGDFDAQYYCFPKTEGDVVAKARLAAEELYKIVYAEKKAKAEQKKRERETKTVKV